MRWSDNKHRTVYEAVNAKTNGKADEFLKGTEKRYKIQNLNILASWIVSYVNSNAPFYIVGDYDCDGVMASSEMKILLEKIGAKKVTVRLPKRMSEGYGFSEKILDEFSEPGVIITVDNGIRAHDAISKAKARNFVVLVTDHHLPSIKDGVMSLPPADLIVDPHVDDTAVAKGTVIGSDFDGYCGAGLVYKLAELMIPDTRELEQISAMAAIATIADVVPLLEDNRVIFKRGMKAILGKKITPGTQKLVDALGSRNVVNETDVGFKIAPMVNAPGRIYDDGAMLSADLVLSKNFYEANKLVELVDKANESRKLLKKEAVERACQKIDEECIFGSNPIVIVDTQTPEGIVGLVAGSLCETNNASAIVFTQSGTPGVLKGSARGADYNNVIEALNTVNDAHPGIIVKYGGHAGAAGLSVREDCIDEFTQAMQDAMGPAQPLPDTLSYDVTINAGEISTAVEEVSKFGPFGEANPSVVFRVNGFKLCPQDNAFFSLIGEDSIRFFGAGCEAVGFGLAKKYDDLRRPLEMDLVGKLSWHNFNGKATPQIELLDFAPTEREVPVTNLSNAVFGLAKANGLFA